MCLKSCNHCNSTFVKKKSESVKYFETKRFCSHKCASLAKKGTSITYIRVISEEQKDKLRKLRKGSIASEETRRKLKEAMDKRYRENPEILKELSIRMKGNKHAVGTPAWNSGKPYPQVSGNKNPNWKGGVSKKNKTERQLFMETLEYKKWRKSVFERDNYTCQECKIRGKKLNADHIKPYSQFPELRTDIDNGRTLCESCHKKTDTYGYRCRKKAEQEVLICD